MGQTRPLFVLFLLFSHDKYSTNTMNDKSIDVVIGTQTWGDRMAGADDSTELWRHPKKLKVRTGFSCRTTSQPPTSSRAAASCPIRPRTPARQTRRTTFTPRQGQLRKIKSRIDRSVKGFVYLFSF